MIFETLRLVVRHALGATAAVGITAFCGYSLCAAPAWFGPVKPVTALDRSDDPVQQAFAILETVRAAPTAKNAMDDPAPVLLLDNWAFTERHDDRDRDRGRDDRDRGRSDRDFGRDERDRHERDREREDRERREREERERRERERRFREHEHEHHHHHHPVSPHH